MKQIKDKLPKEYFSTIKLKSQGKLWCEQNLIDIEEAVQIDSEERALIFIAKRAKKIAEVINSYFSDDR